MAETKERSRADRDTVASLGKGLAVIECFGRDTPRLSITDVAAQTGLERATARRFLLTLTDLGYAAFDGKFFSLTPRALRLGFAYLSSMPLPQLLQRSLEPLAARLEESVSASVLDGDEIVYLARASHGRVMSIGLGVGSRLPAYCTSMGRVLLASLAPDDARERLRHAKRPKLTTHTVTELRALAGKLSEVREKGFEVIDQELEIGLVSIAVPISNARGEVVCALNCGAHRTRLTPTQLEHKVLPELLTVQAELRALLNVG